MWKKLVLPLVIVAAVLTVVVVSPFANAAGQKNSGDVWVDTAGHLGDPGHENDPHLCNPIDVYGSGLADPDGSFQIVAWPPTGDGSTVVASGTWSYDQTQGGSQVITGPLSLAQGHYKLTVSQDPGKEKVFWSTCPIPTPTGAPWPFTP